MVDMPVLEAVVIGPVADAAQDRISTPVVDAGYILGSTNHKVLLQSNQHLYT